MASEMQILFVVDILATIPIDFTFTLEQAYIFKNKLMACIYHEFLLIGVESDAFLTL